MSTPARPDPPSATRRHVALIILWVLACATPCWALQDSLTTFRIQIQDDGVYRLEFDELQKQGLNGPVPIRSLELLNRGAPTPIDIEGAEDGLFGPGDSIRFIGHHLAGQSTYWHEYSPFNVYVLKIAAWTEDLAQETTDAVDASRSMPPAAIELPRITNEALYTSFHLESDLLRIPESGRTGAYEKSSLWAWLQINYLANRPATVPIDLSDYFAGTGEPVGITVRLIGGSNAASANALQIPDHMVQLLIDGEPIGEAVWNGRTATLIEQNWTPRDQPPSEGSELGIRVIPRYEEGNHEALIDVVFLDWIQIRYRRDLEVRSGQSRIQKKPSAANSRIRLTTSTEPAREDTFPVMEVFTSGGFHAAAAPEPSDSNQHINTHWRLELPGRADEFWVVRDEEFKSPISVELEKPSNLESSRDSVDYFIIAHPSLIEEFEPLEKYHESTGLKTEVVSVQDIYDEFNHGIKDPAAIRAFLSHSVQHRARPSARYVLLAGDASWYRKNHGELAEDQRLYDRDLIPSWTIRSRDGPVASDHPFVTFGDDDLRPQLAIGRFPVRTREEARSLVEKTIRYSSSKEAGPWRARMLLVSENSRNLNARNRRLTQSAVSAGLAADEVLAGASADPVMHQSELRASIDEGVLLLHFFGHGGRYMWQTMAANNGSGSNLFDMNDLDLLKPNQRLPVVLSMSCATGPFDHPQADSLAEKFVRLGNRGAIAVIAASARNSPSLRFTEVLIRELLEGRTVGEAMLAAKRERVASDTILFYNLFGDPAISAALPDFKIELKASRTPPLEITATIPVRGFRGRAIIEWYGEDGTFLDTVEVESDRFRITPPESSNGTKIDRLHVYAWQPGSSMDGSGALLFGDFAGEGGRLAEAATDVISGLSASRDYETAEDSDPE